LRGEPDEGGDERPRIIRLDPGAKAAWIAFYNAHAAEQAELDGDLAAAWSKLQGYAARLALVIHLTRAAADDPMLRDAETVDAVSIEAGVTLARWFGAEARRVYAALNGGEADAERRRLVELIERKGGDVSARELMRASRRYPDVAKAQMALQDLVDRGCGEWRQPAQTGRGAPRARRLTLYRHSAGGVDADTNRVGSRVNGISVDVSTISTPRTPPLRDPGARADDSPAVVPAEAKAEEPADGPENAA
jgi:hypothetical protein